MREIKFRAWDNAKDIMYYTGEESDIVFSFDSNGIVATDITEGEEEFKILHHLHHMQYTGLKDKNGKDIYEDDIVRYPDAYMNCGESGDWDEIVSVGQIKWDDEQAQFYVTKRESIDNVDFWEQIDEAEVIGNIHENPNLLSKE